jgi:hypothetical protein
MCLYDDFGTPAYVTPKAQASFLGHILTGGRQIGDIHKAWRAVMAGFTGLMAGRKGPSPFDGHS